MQGLGSGDVVFSTTQVQPAVIFIPLLIPLSWEERFSVHSHVPPRPGGLINTEIKLVLMKYLEQVGRDKHIKSFS